MQQYYVKTNNKLVLTPVSAQVSDNQEHEIYH